MGVEAAEAHQPLVAALIQHRVAQAEAVLYELFGDPDVHSHQLILITSK
jgi:hypothetical protein